MGPSAGQANLLALATATLKVRFLRVAGGGVAVLSVTMTLGSASLSEDRKT